jgi:hypothetical protein
MNVGSLIGIPLTFRSEVCGHAPEKHMNAPAEHKDHASECGADDLKGKKPGAGINVCVCGLGKCAKYSQ